MEQFSRNKILRAWKKSLKKVLTFLKNKVKAVQGWCIEGNARKLKETNILGTGKKNEFGMLLSSEKASYKSKKTDFLKL